MEDYVINCWPYVMFTCGLVVAKILTQMLFED
jgi:hypothetical protein